MARMEVDYKFVLDAFEILQVYGCSKEQFAFYVTVLEEFIS